MKEACVTTMATWHHKPPGSWPIRSQGMMQPPSGLLAEAGMSLESRPPSTEPGDVCVRADCGSCNAGSRVLPRRRQTGHRNSWLLVSISPEPSTKSSSSSASFSTSLHRHSPGTDKQRKATTRLSCTCPGLQPLCHHLDLCHAAACPGQSWMHSDASSLTRLLHPSQHK